MKRLKPSNKNWKSLRCSEVSMMIQEFSKMRPTKNSTQSSWVWCRKNHNKSRVISNPEKLEEPKPLVKSLTIKCSQVQTLFRLLTDAKQVPSSKHLLWVHQTTENWVAEATTEKLFSAKTHWTAGSEQVWIQKEVLQLQLPETSEASA